MLTFNHPQHLYNVIMTGKHSSQLIFEWNLPTSNTDQGTEFATLKYYGYFLPLETKFFKLYCDSKGIVPAPKPDLPGFTKRDEPEIHEWTQPGLHALEEAIQCRLHYSIVLKGDDSDVEGHCIAFHEVPQVHPAEHKEPEMPVCEDLVKKLMEELKTVDVLVDVEEKLGWYQEAI